MLVALLAAIVAARQKPRFDDRSVLLEGNRVLLVAGSVHYPRSTPNQWPAIFKQAKENGINAIDTYVFWGEHEKKRGSFNFEGNLDVKRFIKEAQNAGLYVILRIGPFIAAEFNYGGFPAWLRTIPDIQLRTYNQPFMTEMQKWVTFIVSHVKDLLWENGGPVIMLQIENEYNLQQSTFGDAGQRYISWAVEMATSLTSSAIWFACKQDTTPSILNTHNGYYGLSWFSTRPFKNQMIGISELWSGWYRNWGEAAPSRPAEDLAFSVAQLFARGATYIGYYMWHGGTNFGRTSGGPGVTTSYDYDAPLNEYGLPNEPKYSHLKAMHTVLNKYSTIILSNKPIIAALGTPKTESMTYGSSDIFAFLSNMDPVTDHTVVYRGKSFLLPKWSVTFVSGDLQELFNTAKISSPAVTYSFTPIYTVDSASFLYDVPGVWDNSTALVANRPLEQLDATKDTSDYFWYTQQVRVAASATQISVEVSNVQDIVSIYLDQDPILINRPSKDQQGVSGSVPNKDVGKDRMATLKILCMTMGLKNTASGPKITRGIQGTVRFNGGDITSGRWVHQVGAKGEMQKYYDPETKAAFKKMDTINKAPGWTWYSFNIKPLKMEPGVPYALDLGSMGKGQAFVNGKPIGRYWNIIGTVGSFTNDQFRADPKCSYTDFWAPAKCRGEFGKATQRFYHVPQEWLYKDKTNKVTLFEESGGDLSKVQFIKICKGGPCTGENFGASSTSFEIGNGISIWVIVAIGVGLILLIGAGVFFVKRRRNAAQEEAFVPPKVGPAYPKRSHTPYAG